MNVVAVALGVSGGWLLRILYVDHPDIVKPICGILALALVMLLGWLAEANE